MIRPILLGIAATLVLSNPASVGAAEVGVHVKFSNVEISAIRAFYRHDGGRSAGKGQGKKHGKGNKSLPPGIAKNLMRGKPLPPGIAKQALPTDLIRILPPVPHGLERIIVDHHILLIDPVTRLIHDKLADIF